MFQDGGVVEVWEIVWGQDIFLSQVSVWLLVINLHSLNSQVSFYIYKSGEVEVCVLSFRVAVKTWLRCEYSQNSILSAEAFSCCCGGASLFYRCW